MKTAEREDYSITRQEALDSITIGIRVKMLALPSDQVEKALDNLMNTIDTILGRAENEDGSFNHHEARQEIRDLFADNWADSLETVLGLE